MDVVVREIRDVSSDVREVLEALAWKDIIQENDQVLIKPNFLTKPQAGVTTDLDLLSGIVRVVSERTENVVVGETDSSGRSFDWIIKALDLDCEITNLSKDKAKIVKGKYGNYNLPEHALTSKIINVPVLKTHALTRLSLAVKNLFGLIQDKEKEAFHWTIDKVLYDLYHVLQPEINILDATYAMDRYGPSTGRVKKTNFLAGATDALTLDIAICNLIGINPREISHISHLLDGIPTYTSRGNTIHLTDFEVPPVPYPELVGAFLQHYSPTRKIIQNTPLLTIAKKALKILRIT